MLLFRYSQKTLNLSAIINKNITYDSDTMTYEIKLII